MRNIIMTIAEHIDYWIKSSNDDFDGLNYIEYAKSFVDSIIKKGIDIKVAKVFGSYVKNQQHEYSDIDILLVADVFKGVGFIDYSLISKELVEFYNIHARTYSMQDYDDGDPFIDEIKQNSVSLI